MHVGNLVLRCCLVLVLGIGSPSAWSQNGQAVLEDQSVREVQLATGAFSRGDPLPNWVKPTAIPESAFTNPVVVRLADTQFRVAEVPETFVNRAVQVNDKAVLGSIGQLPIAFVPTYQKLRLHRILILRGEGILDYTQTANIRFLQREAALESGQYTGAVTAVLLLSDVRVGDTLHIQYTLEGENPILGQLYSAFAGWDDSRPVELRSVTLIHPVNRKIRWRMLGDHIRDSVEPSISVSNGNQVMRWEGRQLRGIDVEGNVPSNFITHRYLQFSEYADWKAVARWAEALFPPDTQLTEQLKGVVSTLQHMRSDEDRALGALRWVQDNIRYFSISLGESSHRPFSPSVVAERRYGDCKDKTYLLLTLLREVGIQAKPVLASSQGGSATAKFMPSPLVFDHVIVQATVNGIERYLDGTRIGQAGRLDRLGTNLNGAYVLVVGKDTNALTEVKIANQLELNTIELRERFALQSFDEEGSLQVTKSWNGSMADELRVIASQMTPEQKQKFALTDYEQRYPGLRLESPPVLTDDEKLNQITMDVRFKIPKLASEYGGDWVARFFPGNLRRIFALPQTGNRIFPFTPLPYPFMARYGLEFQWPANVSMMLDPSTRKVHSDVFGIEVAQAFRGNVAKVDLQFTSSVDRVEAGNLPRLLEDIKEFDRAIGGVVVVRRDAIKSDGFLGIGKATLQENLRTSLQQRIRQVSKAISGGRLSGPDLAQAYCERAEAQADAGNVKEGLADAMLAIKTAPSIGAPWRCRANLYFAAGDYGKAVTDYGKALTLGEDDFRLYYRRGHALYYQGKLAEAVSDFAKAAAGGWDESDAIYADLWQIWTLQRLKRELPTDLRERVLRAPTGAWPRPAAAMLVGALTPAQMLSELGKLSGDDYEMTAAEAYFYLGQHHLVHGRIEEAVDAFEKTRQKGITMYIEHVAAGIELDRIKAVLSGK